LTTTLLHGAPLANFVSTFAFLVDESNAGVEFDRAVARGGLHILGRPVRPA
jgi:hypothetical protein